MNPTSTQARARAFARPGARRNRPAAVAILYPKVGNVLRVPLRRTTAFGPGGCEQHPERQFIVWFNRMAAARPGFPMQLKSILLITGQPLCASCRRALATFLGRYHLADRLRVRSLGPAACGCGSSCGGTCGGAPAPGLADPGALTLLLDYLIADAQREEEGLWNWMRKKVGTAVTIGGLMTNPDAAAMPIRDLTTSSAQALAERRKTEALVEGNTRKQQRPPAGPPPPPRPNQTIPASSWQRPGSNLNRPLPPVQWRP